MHRIDSSTAVAVQPAPRAAGTPGYYAKGDPAVGAVPTTMTYEHANAFQEEISAVIEAAEITLDKADNAQLLAAIRMHLQSQGGNYAADTGAVNACVATLSPVPTSPAAILGMPIRIKFAHTNTGHSTLSLNGQPAKAIVNPDGSALLAGQIAINGIGTVIFDGTSFELLSITSPLLGFGSTFANPGIQKLPSGLIVQMGAVAPTTSADAVALFATAFPGGTLSMTLGCAAGIGAGYFATFNNFTKASVNIGSYSTATVRINANINYIAVGF
jgi:hypothetical protein